MADRGGPAEFRPFFGGDDATAHPGPGAGLGLLAPTAEPASAGAPPLAPDLIERAAYTIRTREARTACGRARSFPRETRGSVRIGVVWSGRTAAERDLVVAFLAADAQAGRLGFAIEPDGPGTGAVIVRAMSAPEVTTEEGDDVFSVRVEAEDLVRGAP